MKNGMTRSSLLYKYPRSKLNANLFVARPGARARAGFAGDPFLVLFGGDNFQGAFHAEMARAAKLGAIDHVGADFCGREMGRDDHAGDRILRHTHRPAGKTMDDIKGTNI